ncbi:hypothetical protein [Corynebacterium sp. J010B-136]|uniref:hypothetical protein n=1 Tax=Corynebacterium sp. J010B-136 TaxID=2099401 RepID=UPI0011B052FD|nr:hypothetical protein [Corynebacterium sp. J010B-136]
MVMTRQAHNRADCSPWQDAAFEPASGQDLSKLRAPALHTMEKDTLLNQSFTDSRDTESTYHLFKHGIDTSKPVGALIHLHGDGGDEYNFPEGFATCAAAVAAEYNFITVVPRTPDKKSSTWWRNLRKNQRWLDDLTAQITSDFNVDKNQLWWSGYSGGAEFISYALLHKRPELVTGGAIMLAGGGAPSWENKHFESEYRASTPLYWVVGEYDDGSTSQDGFDALGAAHRGSRWYRNEGFSNINLEVLPNYDHYNLPTIDVLQDTLRGLVGTS